MENDKLKKQIQELFRLFKIMMEKYPPDDIPGMDKMQMEQLKMFLSNYDNMKDQLSVEMLGTFDNAMAQQMIEMLIKKLREQLGEDADIDMIEEESKVEIKEKEFKALPTEDRYIALIDAIDEQLKNKDLSMEEIDNLLDKRSKIQNSIQKSE